MTWFDFPGSFYIQINHILLLQKHRFLLKLTGNEKEIGLLGVDTEKPEKEPVFMSPGFITAGKWIKISESKKKSKRKGKQQAFQEKSDK
jgi:hypothetical protein